MRANIPCHKCLPLILWATTLSEFSFFPDGTLKSHLWMKVYVVSQLKKTEDWPGDVIVFQFSCECQSFKINRKHAAQKRSRPLDFNFISDKSLFCWWSRTHVFVSLSICVCFFLQGQLYLQR
jgi:hypothetical protein